MKIDCGDIKGPTAAKQRKRMMYAETGSSAGNVGVERVPTEQEVLNYIGMKCFENVDPSKPEQRNEFLRYLQDVRKVLIVGTKEGSLIITMACNSLEILDELWRDYCKGYVNKMAQQYLITEDVLKTFGLTNLTLKTAIDEEKYRACRNQFKRGEFARK